MALAFNGTTEIITATVPALAFPFTIGAMFNQTVVSGARGIVSFGVSGGGSRQDISITGTNLRALSADGGGTSTADTTLPTAGIWNHGCGVFSAANSRSIYLNGGAKVTNTVSRSFTINRMIIGASQGVAGAGEFFNGSLAEVGIWTAALTDEEVLSLSRGCSPLLVRPQNLLYYIPLVRGIIDIRSGLSMTPTGTSVSTHPRVILS